MSTKRLTKNQLRIITGIEMFYGNFEELKYIYASREIPELAEYMNKLSELKSIKNNMTSVAASKGMQALNEEMKKAKKVGSEITKVKTKLLEKMPKLNKYKITEEDIENMYSQND